MRAHEVYGVNVEPDALPAFVECTWGAKWAMAVGLMEQPEGVDEFGGSDQPAQVFDGGAHLIISGPTQLSVLTALEDLGKAGCKVLSPIQKVGTKWIATCDRPSDGVDDCKVEELGFMRIVTGATRDAVSGKVEELMNRGARLVHDLEEARGLWTAVCEVHPE